MPQRRPVWPGDIALSCLLGVCSAFAHGAAALHSAAVQLRLAGISPLVIRSPDGVLPTLRQIWFGRFARELLSLALRSRLRAAAIARVSAGASTLARGSCIFAICHSPWQRLLATWCGERAFALLPAADRWARHAGAMHVAWGTEGLRRALRHLRSGGQVIVIADVFLHTGGVPVRFLDENRMANPFAARLAALAKVPVHAVIPAWHGQNLRLDVGATFTPAAADLGPERMAVELLGYFDRGLRMNPAAWGDIFHLRLRPRRQPGQAASPPAAATANTRARAGALPGTGQGR
jgi:hypothetical protein